MHQAQDWTQVFFVRLLSRVALADLHPDRGQFRSFLPAAAKHYVCKEFDKQSAIMRGGHVVLRSLDYEFGERQMSKELSRNKSAESIFERRWAGRVDKTDTHDGSRTTTTGKNNSIKVYRHFQKCVPELHLLLSAVSL